MAETSSDPKPTTVVTSNKPVSEALLNDKVGSTGWNHTARKVAKANKAKL
jgi:hypothetical protein